MKKNKFILNVISLFAFLVFATSCDVLDTIKTFPVNIPITVTFSTSGSNSSMLQSSTFCINDNETYQEYKDDISELSYVEAAIRTISYSPSNVRGDIVLRVYDAMGTELFKEVLEDVSPGDYVSTPYVVVLNTDEFNALNSYLQQALESGGEICLTAEFSMNITQGSAPYSFEGALDIVFEAKTTL